MASYRRVEILGRRNSLAAFVSVGWVLARRDKMIGPLVSFMTSRTTGIMAPWMMSWM